MVAAGWRSIILFCADARLVGLACFLAVGIACGDDDGGGTDSGMASDGSAADASDSRDTGVEDSSRRDTSAPEDSGNPGDVGTPEDGGAPDDGGLPQDGGIDSGSTCGLSCVNGACADTTPPSCMCEMGWTGELCDVDIDECMEDVDDCHDLATCTNTDGGFVCECTAPHVGDGMSCACPMGMAGDSCEDCAEGFAPLTGGGCAQEQTLTVTIEGDGRGIVTVEGQTIECTETCEITVADGDMLTVTAAPGSTTAVVSWSDGCTGDTCDVTIAGDTGVTLTWELQHNIIFASSMTPAVGDIGSVAAADAHCVQMASDAGLHATQWVAFLASNGPCPDEVSTDCNGFERLERAGARGWVNTQGQPVADTLAQLRDDRIIWYPVRYEEDGGGGDGDHICVTGLDARFEVGGTCTDYSDTDRDMRASWGRAGSGDRNIFAQNSNLRCSNAASFYCMSTDHDTPLPAPSDTGRLAFVTASNFVVGVGGLDSADALCQREACDAGLTGSSDCDMDLGSDATFLAFLETNDATAGSRFDSDGEDFVRADGVVFLRASQLEIADTADLLPVSPANQRADGTLDVNVNVWTGAGGFTCDNWTDPTLTGDVGGVENIFFHMRNSGARDCSFDAFRLVCMEE